jgi:diguanylate cyclase
VIVTTATHDQLRSLAERVLAMLHQPISVGTETVNISVSIGFAHSCGDIADMLKRADQALYEVKRSGKGAVAAASHQVHAAAVSTFQSLGNDG